MNENSFPLLFQSLASLEEKINPGQLESDKDQLLLINEKEKLLRELRSLLSQNKGTKLKELKIKCSRLEQDLNDAQEMTNRCIAGKRKTIIIAEQKSNAIKMIFFSSSRSFKDSRNKANVTPAINRSHEIYDLIRIPIKGFVSLYIVHVLILIPRFLVLIPCILQR